MTIYDFCFNKSTTANEFYNYFCKNNDTSKQLVDGNIIIFHHYKYTAHVKLDNNIFKVSVYDTDNGSSVNDSISIVEDNNDKPFEEATFIELAKTDPKTALAEVVDAIIDSVEMDKQNANIELAIKLFLYFYKLAIISDKAKNISKAAVAVINMTGQDVKYTEKFVSVALKGISEIKADTLDDEGKTLYETLNNEFVKKLQQQT